MRECEWAQARPKCASNHVRHMHTQQQPIFFTKPKIVFWILFDLWCVMNDLSPNSITQHNTHEEEEVEWMYWTCKECAPNIPKQTIQPNVDNFNKNFCMLRKKQTHAQSERKRDGERKQTENGGNNEVKTCRNCSFILWGAKTNRQRMIETPKMRSALSE